MVQSTLCCLLVAGSLAVPSAAREVGVARPDLVLKQIVEGMPRSERQEVSVLTATFRPGDRTVFHTHRYPVTVYILEGAFTLEIEGRPPVVVKAGEAYVEPPQARMTGYNRSATDTLKLVIVYVGEPGMPFLDMQH